MRALDLAWLSMWTLTSKDFVCTKLGEYYLTSCFNFGFETQVYFLIFIYYSSVLTR